MKVHFDRGSLTQLPTTQVHGSIISRILTRISNRGVLKQRKLKQLVNPDCTEYLCNSFNTSGILAVANQKTLVEGLGPT